MVTALLDAWDDVAVEAAVQQGTLKTSTARSYRSMVRTHLKPAFGAVRSDQLTPQVIAKWSRERAHDIEDGELAPKTFNNLLNLLSAVLAWARRPAQRSLAHDPLVGVKRLPRRQIERPFLEPDQIARLLNVAVPPEDTIVMLGAYAGLRRGELCALRWEDIDWGDGEHGRIWIRRAISGGKVGTPKTKGSVRMINVPGALLTNLQAYRRTCQDARDTDFLFRSAEGTALDPDNLAKRIFVPLVQRAKLSGVGLHTLRHTFASLLISHGESIKYVSRQPGHASIHITADTYGTCSKRPASRPWARCAAMTAAAES